MDCDGGVCRITVDLAAGTAERSAGHRVVSASRDAVPIERTRHLFQELCDADPIGTPAPMELVTFAEKLNRVVLTVRNVPAGKKGHLTWSEVSSAKTSDGQPVWPTIVEADFTPEQLATGVNLAAVFATTPFEHAFSKPHQAARTHQDFETPLTKQWLNNERAWAAKAPAAADGCVRLAATGQRTDQRPRAIAAAYVLPVRHMQKCALRQSSDHR